MPVGALPRCGVSAAEYIAMRRFTASAVASTITVGASSAIICSAVNCAAPAITMMEKPITSTMFSPASEPTTPNSRPKGTMTSAKGAEARQPRR